MDGRAALVACWLIAVAPLAGRAEDTTSVAHRVAQGRFFLERGLGREALREFEAAALQDEGRSDPEVQALLARACLAVGDVGGAIAAIRAARALARGTLDPEFAALFEYLAASFGKVLVVGAEAEGAALPAPVQPILDPELRRLFEAQIERLRAIGEAGSTSAWLPVGSYRAGGHVYEVAAAGFTRIDVRPAAGGAGGVYGEAGPRGGGVSASFGLSGGGAIGAQQGTATGAIRVRGGLRVGGRSAGPVLTAAGVFEVGRAERFVSDVAAPAGGFAGALLGGGFAVMSGPALLEPSIECFIGAAAPTPGGLPEGYSGPRSYLVVGPELGLAWVGPGVLVAPAIRPFASVRASVPLGLGRTADPRPHLTMLLGAEFGLRTR